MKVVNTIFYKEGERKMTYENDITTKERTP